MINNLTKQEVELKFDKIDIPSSNLEEMVAFYTEVFCISFQEIIENINSKEWKLYLGHLGGVKFFLVPNEPSGTEPNQPGIHQFHLQISNLNQFIERIKEKGYQVDKVPFGEGSENYCLRDPDGHPWILSN